jgi:hypothetical protein
MDIKVFPKFNVDDALYEAKQRCFWFIEGYYIHGMSVEIFKNLSTERLCELYNVDIDHFRRIKK